MARLDAIASGMKIRRRLDAQESDAATERVRRDVVGRLAELQRRTVEDLAALPRGSARHREVAARVRQWLGEARVASQNMLTVLEFEPLHQAMAIEALRADLEWLGVAVARLDGEPPPAPGLWLDAELERLRGLLGRADGRHPDELDDGMAARCEAMQATLLGRRVGRELARTFQDAAPDALWSQRFRLSRLQAHVAALDQTADGDRGLSPYVIGGASGPGEWLRDLELRRIELADEADGRMAVLPPRERTKPCSDAVTAAFDEIGEMTALLEQLPPHRAVRRLELAREDLERLGESCRAWADDSAFEEDATPEAEAPLNGVPPMESAADAEPAPADPILPVEPTVEVGPDSRTLDREAVAAMRAQAGRIDRLGRRVRGEWREKLLTIRMEAVLGCRGAAVAGECGPHPDPDPDRADRGRVAPRARRAALRRPASVLRLGRPGDLRGAAGRGRRPDVAGPRARLVSAPAPRDRPDPLAAVRLRGAPDRPGRDGDARGGGRRHRGAGVARRHREDDAGAPDRAG